MTCLDYWMCTPKKFVLNMNTCDLVFYCLCGCCEGPVHQPWAAWFFSVARNSSASRGKSFSHLRFGEQCGRRCGNQVAKQLAFAEHRLPY